MVQLDHDRRRWKFIYADGLSDDELAEKVGRVTSFLE